MNKAIYIGAGVDIIPVIVLDNIAEFIYIDSRPRSECGMLYYETGELYRKHFINELEQIMLNNNFQVNTTTYKMKDNFLEYNTYNKTLKYFINTPFPEKLTNEIKKEIAESENLIIAGFDPNKEILKLMPNLKNIYCDIHTVYGYTYDENKDISLFYELNKENNKYNYFLIKETKYIEYWISNNIVPKIKNIFEIVQYDTLNNLYKDACKYRSQLKSNL